MSPQLVPMIIFLELLGHYWAGWKHRLLLARYLYHHHEGAKLLPETELLTSQVFQSD